MPTIIIVTSNLHILIGNKQLPAKFVVSPQLALSLEVSANKWPTAVSQFFLHTAHEPIIKRVKLNYKMDKLGKNGRCINHWYSRLAQSTAKIDST